MGRGDFTLAAESGGSPWEAWSWWNRPLGVVSYLVIVICSSFRCRFVCALCVVAVTSVPLSLKYLYMSAADVL